MNIIDVSGTPYEQGFSQGKQAVDIILKNIKLVREKLAADHVDMQKYTEFVLKNAKFIENAHPYLIEEIKGISDGSGIGYEEILMLNIPAYFMTGYFQECSMVLARGKATEDGKTYLIKNRDMGTHIEQAVIKRTHTDGRSIIEINGVGTVTYPASGLNSSGLAVATTGFWSKLAPSRVEDVDFAHIFVNVRILLEDCRTAREVLKRLETYPRMNGLNIIAADEKDAFVIETTRDGLYVQEDDGTGILYRTNHYVNPEISPLNPAEKEYPSTHMRYRRIGELLNEQYGHIRFQDMFRIMSDHKDGLYGICRHPEGNIQSATVSSGLVVIEDREAWTTIGNPCMNLRYAKI